MTRRRAIDTKSLNVKLAVVALLIVLVLACLRNAPVSMHGGRFRSHITSTSFSSAPIFVTTIIVNNTFNVSNTTDSTIFTHSVKCDTSTDFYVSVAHGDDSNCGDSLHPFKTINRAVFFAKPGTTINVLPGKYHALNLHWCNLIKHTHT